MTWLLKSLQSLQVLALAAALFMACALAAGAQDLSGEQSETEAWRLTFSRPRSSWTGKPCLSCAAPAPCPAPNGPSVFRPPLLISRHRHRTQM